MKQFKPTIKKLMLYCYPNHLSHSKDHNPLNDETYDLTVIAGNRCSGKTYYCLKRCEELLNQGYKVLLVTPFEFTTRDIAFNYSNFYEFYKQRKFDCVNFLQASRYDSNGDYKIVIDEFDAGIRRFFRGNEIDTIVTGDWKIQNRNTMIKQKRVKKNARREVQRIKESFSNWRF